MEKKPLPPHLKSLLALRRLLGREASQVGRVIEPLRGKIPDWGKVPWRLREKGPNRRGTHWQSIVRGARESGRDAKRGFSIEYGHYGEGRDWRPELRAVENELNKRSKEPFRFLDVGPGAGNYLKSLIKDLPNAEVHSLSPEQINPIVEKGSKCGAYPALTTTCPLSNYATLKNSASLM